MLTTCMGMIYSAFNELGYLCDRAREERVNSIDIIC